ncbi:Mce protein [Mycolicibacterium sp.]|uniref:Mce protein n=1 Tax=Mycolicibacterium sp. TaxID=2320850 RepID=UPI003D13701B
MSGTSDRDDTVSETSAAAEDADDSDVAEPGPAKVTSTRWPWKRYAGIGLVAAVYLGAFGLAGVLGWKLWEQHTLTQAGQNAQQTAVRYAEVLTSIDSNNLDQNFAEVLNGATGDFKDMYTKDSMQLRQLLIDNKATAHGVVIDSAIQSESRDKVTVLLLVDQTVTNTARPDARSDSSRMKITMEKVHDRWLASNVELP